MNSPSQPDTPMGYDEFAVRALWIALRLLFVVWLAKPGQSFVYQLF